MAYDVVCLRPESDFLNVGVKPPAGLAIAYREPGDPELATLIRQARALVIPAVGPALSAELFDGTALKLVQVTGAGLDRVDRSVLSEEGIALANVPGGSNAALAEFVVSNAISLSRGFYEAGAAIRAGNYAAHRKTMVASSQRGLGGLTVGLVGMGTIGVVVAERCRDMGANIVYSDPVPPRDPARLEALGARAVELNELLMSSDVISLHVPLIDATRNLIDAGKIAMMKPEAILINAARGGIVDEAALADAIEKRRIAGAAVDVFSTEPPPADNPLLNVSAEAAGRLILTPHIAGVSLQASQYLFAEAWRNVVRVLIEHTAPCHAVA
jgi:(S)-sulfolactate dehydrogenase